MNSVADYPLLVFLLSFFAMSFSTWVGGLFIQRLWALRQDIRDDFTVILTPTLTLLGLLIAFSFSMAISRYDQRKNYEEAEANAIGTEYLRATLLSSADANKVQALLVRYLDQRIAHYQTRNISQLRQTDAATSRIETEMWAVVSVAAKTRPSNVTALAVSGMNDVLNSRGYTQAAWWNRIPPSAWLLMLAIAIFCNLMIGFGAYRTAGRPLLFLVIPIVVSICFYLISDIESPRQGIIRVSPQNLISLSHSLQSQGKASPSQQQ